MNPCNLHENIWNPIKIPLNVGKHTISMDDTELDRIWNSLNFHDGAFVFEPNGLFGFLLRVQTAKVTFNCGEK